MNTKACTVSAAARLPSAGYTDNQTTGAKNSGKTHKRRLFAQINGTFWYISRSDPLVRRCNNCASRLASKFVCTDNVHIVCDVCEPKILQDRVCPECRETVADKETRESKNSKLNRQLNSTEVECTRCPWQGTYGKIEEHIKDCLHAYFPCMHAWHGCQEKLGSLNDDHQLSCRYKPIKPSVSTGVDTQNLKAPHGKRAGIPCRSNCGRYFDSYARQDEHSKTCPFEKISCPYLCGSWIERRSMQEHKDNCDLRRVPCPNKCGWSITFRDICQADAFHYKICPKATVQCQFCDKSMQRRLVAIHQEKRCQDELCSDPKLPEWY